MLDPVTVPAFLSFLVPSKPNIYPGRNQCPSSVIWQDGDHPNRKKCFPWSLPNRSQWGKNASLDGSVRKVCVYRELCQVPGHSNNWSDPQTQGLLIYFGTSGKDSWKIQHQEEMQSSNPILWPSLIWNIYMASKVIVVGEGNYFLLEVLDSFEFCEISCSRILFFFIDQYFLVSCWSVFSSQYQSP